MHVQHISALLLLLASSYAAAPALAARHTLAAAPPTAAASLRCYTGAGPAADGRPVVVSMAFNKADGIDVCVRYQFPCSSGDSSCSAAEAKAGTLKWQYIATSAANCAYLKQVGRNTLCCATDGCNKPDPKLDPATQIQQYPAAAAGAAPAGKPAPVKPAASSVKP